MDPAEFNVGWICALPPELAASRGMLDEEYDASKIQKHARDTNSYCLGQIAVHKIVLTCLQSAGTNQAGSTARHMYNTFQNLDFILMVGIGGGIPGSNSKSDIRLGDVVVSMPAGSHGGVIQYDAGKFVQDQQFLPIGALQAPPSDLQKTVKHLIAKHESEENRIKKHIDDMLDRNSYYTRAETDYSRPGKEHDLLFKAEYVHEGDDSNCDGCDKGQMVVRQDRPKDDPVMHYGNIASGSSVVRDAIKRDELRRIYGALCIEMEAAGLMNEFRCLVIRGICDYSDSHKNKDWQRYAAAVAAAYAKELLGAVSSTRLIRSGPLGPTKDVANSPSAGQGTSTPSQAFERDPPFRVGQFMPPFSRNSSFPASTSQSINSGVSSSNISTRVPFSNTQLKAAQIKHPSPSPQRSTVDHRSLSHTPSIPSTSPTGPSAPTWRPTFDKPGSSRSLSKASSRSFPAGVWEGREGEVILIEAQIKRYQSHSARSQSPENMENCKVRIFELVNGKFRIPTRRLTVQNCGPKEEYISYWMPLDDVHVRIRNQQVLISWSDCSHVNSESINYRTTFASKYNPGDHNRQLELDFEITDISVIQTMADVLLHPTLEKSQFEQVPVMTESTKISPLKVYGRRVEANFSAVDADQSADFAILVTSTVADSTRCSKIYFGRFCLDLELGIAHEYIIFKGIHRLNYISSLKKASEKDLLRHLDLEGGPDMWGFVLEDLELWPAEYDGFLVADLMELLTGWRLVLSEETISVVLKAKNPFSLSKRIEGALATIWKRETHTRTDLQLLVRATTTSRESNDIPWLSTSLAPDPVKLIIPESNTIGIEDQAYLKGTKVSIDQMCVDQCHVEESKTQNIRLQFGTSASAHNFYETARSTNQLLRRPTTVASKPNALHRELIASQVKSNEWT